MYKTFNGMTWPAPCERMNEIEWNLRYSTPSRNDCLAAASIISAYRQMIFDTKGDRQKVIAELRQGPNK